MKSISLSHRCKHEKYEIIWEFPNSRQVIQKLKRRATKMTQRWEGIIYDYMRFAYIIKIKKKKKNLQQTKAWELEMASS